MTTEASCLKRHQGFSIAEMNPLSVIEIREQIISFEGKNPDSSTPWENGEGGRLYVYNGY